jgi:excisionase family DNA binding protein
LEAPGLRNRGSPQVRADSNGVVEVEGALKWCDMQTIQRPYMSMSEVAHELGVSVATIRRAVERGALPATKLGCGRSSSVRIKREHLERWLWAEGEPGAES